MTFFPVALRQPNDTRKKQEVQRESDIFTICYHLWFFSLAGLLSHALFRVVSVSTSLAPAGQMSLEGIYVIILKMLVNELTFDFFIKMSAIT